MLICSAGETIEIRLLEESHAEDLEALSRDYGSRPQLNEWWYKGTAVEFIRKGLVRFAEGVITTAGIWFEGRLAGVILLSIDARDSSIASIDYGLAPAFRGRGIVTRACAAMIDYAFQEKNVERIKITLDTANKKSSAIPERLGLRLERVVKKAIQYGDFYGDLAIYSTTKSEWENTEAQRRRNDS